MHIETGVVGNQNIISSVTKLEESDLSSSNESLHSQKDDSVEQFSPLNSETPSKTTSLTIDTNDITINIADAEKTTIDGSIDDSTDIIAINKLTTSSGTLPTKPKDIQNIGSPKKLSPLHALTLPNTNLSTSPKDNNKQPSPQISPSGRFHISKVNNLLIIILDM